MHVEPLAPHASVDVPDWQVSLLQQPSQVFALQLLTRSLQVWLEHCCVEGHATQSLPPVPHAASSLPATHVSVIWSQQPSQVVVSHFAFAGPQAAKKSVERRMRVRTVPVHFTRVARAQAIGVAVI